MTHSDTWNALIDRVLIWDFRGSHSEQTCVHFAKHLGEELVALEKSISNSIQPSPLLTKQVITHVECENRHSFCAAWIHSQFEEETIKKLKPQRVCQVFEFLAVYPDLFNQT
jgi:hypothetical protein